MILEEKISEMEFEGEIRKLGKKEKGEEKEMNEETIRKL